MRRLRAPRRKSAPRRGRRGGGGRQPGHRTRARTLPARFRPARGPVRRGARRRIRGRGSGGGRQGTNSRRNHGPRIGSARPRKAGAACRHSRRARRRLANGPHAVASGGVLAPHADRGGTPGLYLVRAGQHRAIRAGALVLPVGLEGSAGAKPGHVRAGHAGVQRGLRIFGGGPVLARRAARRRRPCVLRSLFGDHCAHFAGQISGSARPGAGRRRHAVAAFPASAAGPHRQGRQGDRYSHWRTRGRRSGACAARRTPARRRRRGGGDVLDRRVDAYGRIHSRREKGGRQGGGRHGQRARRLPFSGDPCGGGYGAGPHRSDGRGSAAVETENSAPGGPRSGLVCACRAGGRPDCLPDMAGGGSGPGVAVRAGRSGVRIDHCLPLRHGVGYARIRDGRFGEGGRTGHALSERGRYGSAGRGRYGGLRQDRHANGRAPPPYGYDLLPALVGRGSASSGRGRRAAVGASRRTGHCRGGGSAGAIHTRRRGRSGALRPGRLGDGGSGGRRQERIHWLRTFFGRP